MDPLRSLLLIFCVFLLSSRIFAKIVVMSITTLDHHNDASRIRYLNITTKSENQYLNYDLTLAIPLDNKIGGTFLVEYAADGKHYIKIRLQKEKNACRAYNAYAGGIWHDIEKAAGIAPGVCPIKAGNYTVHNHLLDFTRMAFQALPYGKIRITIIMVRNSDQSQFNGFSMEMKT